MFLISLTSGQSSPCLHQVGEGGLQLRGDDEGDEAEQSEAQAQHQGHRGGGERGEQRGEQAGRAGQQDAWTYRQGEYYIHVYTQESDKTTTLFSGQKYC